MNKRRRQEVRRLERLWNWDGLYTATNVYWVARLPDKDQQQQHQAVMGHLVASFNAPSPLYTPLVQNSPDLTPLLTHPAHP